jgi:hypothetical protein
MSVRDLRRHLRYRQQPLQRDRTRSCRLRTLCGAALSKWRALGRAPSRRMNKSESTSMSGTWRGSQGCAGLRPGTEGGTPRAPLEFAGGSPGGLAVSTFGWRTAQAPAHLLRLADIQHDPNNNAGDHENCLWKVAGIELRERRGALLAGAPPVRPAIALRLSPTASRSAFCDAASRFYRGLTMPSFALSESPDSRGDYDGAHCPRKVKLLCALQL